MENNRCNNLKKNDKDLFETKFSIEQNKTFCSSAKIS